MKAQKKRLAVTLTLTQAENELLCAAVEHIGRLTAPSTLAAHCFATGLVSVCRAKGIRPDLVHAVEKSLGK